MCANIEHHSDTCSIEKQCNIKLPYNYMYCIDVIQNMHLSVATTLSLLILSVVVMYNCETFHIVPVNSTKRCEEEPCLTLDQLARRVANENFTNLVLHFLPGEHFLNQTELDISNMKSSKMIGSSLATTIWFQGNTISICNMKTLEVENITLASSNKQSGNVEIKESENIVLIGCSLNRVRLFINTKGASLTPEILHDTNFSLSITNCLLNHSSLKVSISNENIAFLALINNSK